MLSYFVACYKNVTPRAADVVKKINFPEMSIVYVPEFAYLKVTYIQLVKFFGIVHVTRNVRTESAPMTRR